MSKQVHFLNYQYESELSMIREKPKKVFLSGPMTGYPGYNFQRFNLAEKQLADAGIECVNPVHICKKYKEKDVLSSKEVFDKMVAEQQEAEKECDAILLLDCWQMSKGVRLELKTALDNDMEIYLEEDLDICGGRLCSRI